MNGGANTLISRRRRLTAHLSDAGLTAAHKGAGGSRRRAEYVDCRPLSVLGWGGGGATEAGEGEGHSSKAQAKHARGT